MQVIKKTGYKEEWNPDKIKRAVKLASDRVNVSLPDWCLDNVVEAVKGLAEDFMWGAGCPVAKLHQYVIQALKKNGFNSVAEAYQEYRDYKTKDAKVLEELFQKSKEVLYLGDRENANFDSALISTKGSLIRGLTTRTMYERYFLSKEELAEIKKGSIYIHDLRDMLLGSFNCCLFDMATVLKNGFVMSNVEYTEPTSALSALQVIGDVTLVASSQQFGGFTVAEIDKVLLPYCKKTLYDSKMKYLNILGTDEDIIPDYAYKDLERELQQGFQSLECKLNTIPSSRGDFAFTTITFGEIPEEYDQEDRKIMCLINETILKTRLEGHGKNHVPVLFPKLVYLYAKKQHDKHKDQQEIFDLAVQCSAKCMMPDYLSIDSEWGTVSKLYKEHGVITSPMGA